MRHFLLNLAIYAPLTAAAVVILYPFLSKRPKEWWNDKFIRIWDWLDDQKSLRLVRSYRSRWVQVIVFVVVCGVLGYGFRHASLPYFARISTGVLFGSGLGILLFPQALRWIIAKDRTWSLLLRSVLVALATCLVTLVIVAIGQAIAGVKNPEESLQDGTAPSWLAFMFGFGFGISSVPFFYFLITLLTLLAVYPLSALCKISAFILGKMLDHPGGVVGVSGLVFAIAVFLKWGLGLS